MDSFKKIRNRLTLLYTTALVLLSFSIAVILYVSIWFSIERENAESLRISARQLASAYELYKRSGDPVNIDAVTETLLQTNTAYRIYNDDFEIVLKSDEEMVDSETGFYLFKKLLASKGSGTEITDFDKYTESFKVLNTAFVTSEGNFLGVELTRNMSAQREVLRFPFIVTISGILIGTLISFILGNIFARRALLPIKESYEQQRNFIADASHELRTPVAVVLANLEVLKKHPDETIKSQEKWVDNAHSEIMRTKAVVEDLLLLAKADAGERITQFKPVDLSYAIMEVTESLTGLAEQKGIKLIVEIGVMEAYVSGDEKRLKELITILTENAIKYTNPGGKVRVELEGYEDKYKLKVIDNGIGIPLKEQENIFKRFYRVDKARSREEGGTGLGLSIAQWIIKEHNIELNLTSREEEGTTFELTFEKETP